MDKKSNLPKKYKVRIQESSVKDVVVFGESPLEVEANFRTRLRLFETVSHRDIALLSIKEYTEDEK